MNRATIAFTGSAFLILLGVINLQEAWEAIDPGTIFFLLSMMIVNGFLTYSGFFGLALYLLVRLAKSPFGLLIILTVGTGLLSALFINDTMALVFTPLTLHVTSTLGLNPIPYLLALAAATNIGSVATINGNPQNILIGSFSEIGYLELNLISNVPAVLLLQPLIDKTDTHSWLLLAAGSTLAGNLTLFGAVANL
ncbi:hypothetical protein IQ238_25320 [Pleurocapsales cyanobacterium LEGE 06147]|nr:hypothetical protein [Pleurocapsales cyanobacterium LEGE 06147]